MRRIVITAFLAVFILACSSAQTEHRKNVKISGSEEVSTIAAGVDFALIDGNAGNLVKRISLPNLTSLLNISSGNLSQEEVEDILGAAFVNGSHTGASFVYNDNGAGAGTIDITVTGGGASDGNDFVTGATVLGNTLTLTIPNQPDVVIDVSALNTEGGTASNSPVQDLEHWKGTYAEYLLITPQANVIYTITDYSVTPVSLAATSGSWTPTVSDASGNYTLDASSCNFYKIGNLVHIVIRVDISLGRAPSGQLRISGLPFNMANAAYTTFATEVNELAASSRNFDQIVSTGFGATELRFKVRNNGDSSFAFWSDVEPSGSMYIEISGTYLSQ